MGGDNPTIQTPAHSIEVCVSLVHHGGMESITTYAAGAFLDPVVIGSAATLTVALVSGAAARVVESAQDHLPGARRRARPH